MREAPDMTLSRPLKNVASEGQARRNQPKKRSLRVVNEHSEADFNAAWPSAVVFQQPATALKRRFGTGLLCAGVLLGALQLAAPCVQGAERAAAPARPTQELKETKNYTVTSAPTAPLHLDPPQLPDLSGYTAQAVEAKIERGQRGKVVVRRMLQQDALKDFIGGNERLREWVKRQNGMPHAIFVEGGYVTPQDIAKALPDSQFREVEPGVYLARLPIVVAQGATLQVGKQTRELRLSQERGVFMVNDGKLFVTDTRLTAWREADNGPASFRTPDEFRPFLVSWGGSELYISHSVVTSLGYNNSKSYGVSITQYTPGMHKRLQRSEPTGWLIDSEFVDHWYGFYCYEAADVVVKGNTYRDNIVYGIDPHDRSHGLVIAENTVYGTRKKHGIIISREVNDSWIINNKSYANKLSGIVLDRNSVNNLVAYNEVYQNHADGITIYESSNNLLWANKVLNNARHGIRLRNSTNVRLYENISAANQLTGVYGHIKDLSDTDRNVALDPFDTQVSMIVVGGTLAANGSSPLSIDSPLSVELYRVELIAPSKSTGISFAGILGEKQEEILDLMVRRQLAVLIDPVESQAELQD
ncbi:poly(beta-D-mannuronate) C5 epimerase [Pseudomonas benzenivorans]|nr:poly(beta-D-mannuronate) C5 epimerase [Pseudomonas benzenivorans]